MAVIGIDIGTQSLKAVVADDAMAAARRGERCLSAIYPAPGWAEQDPALWFERAAAGDRRRACRGGIGSRTSGRIAICGTARRLHWRRPRRSRAGAARSSGWTGGPADVDGIDPVLIRERTGLVLDATHMAAKIRWLPATCTRTRRGGGLASAGELRGRGADRPRASSTTRLPRPRCSTASAQRAVTTISSMPSGSTSEACRQSTMRGRRRRAHRAGGGADRAAARHRRSRSVPATTSPIPSASASSRPGHVRSRHGRGGRRGH